MGHNETSATQEEFYSKTQARTMRLKSKPDATPAGWRSGWHGSYPVFRRCDLVPIAHKQTTPGKTIDLLAAVFAVTRAAKRYRDAASKYYRSRKHGLAGYAADRKRDLYALKDRGIVAAFAEGRITPAGLHGSLVAYRGEGYCYHSYLKPPELPELPLISEAILTVEAKPRKAKEPRLCDAIATLTVLPAVPTTWHRLEPPSFPQPSNHHRHGDPDADDGAGCLDDDWDANEA